MKDTHTLLVLPTFLAFLFHARCYITQEEENIGNSRQRRNAIHRDKNKIWNASEIPYATDPNFPSNVKKAVEDSILLIQNNTCVKFINRTNEDKYIDFIFDAVGSGCGAGLGVSHWGETKVTLSRYCASVSPVIHELFHALGFYHEHNRPDSLKYVAFNKSNAITNMAWTLGPYGVYPNGTADGTLEVIGPYDYRSIMHYNNFGMARAGTTGFTLMNKFRKDMQIGKQSHPTEIDYLKLSVYYKCPGLSIPYGATKGEWGPWSAWTPKICPQECGPDYLQRFRWCNGTTATECSTGVSTEIKRCDNCAGSNCKNTYSDGFCTKYATACSTGSWMKHCRKHCKYCGQSCLNTMTDYYCLYYAKHYCNQSWAQNECPVTCNICYLNECNSSPCQNDGTCTDQFNSYKCTCRSGYNGTNCEIEKCRVSNPCKNNGKCRDVGIERVCDCQTGFAGKICDEKLLLVTLTMGNVIFNGSYLNTSDANTIVDLSNPNSVLYQGLKSAMEPEVEKKFKEAQPEIITAQITKFSVGSLIVDVTATFNSTFSEDVSSVSNNIIKTLNGALSTPGLTSSISGIKTIDYNDCTLGTHNCGSNSTCTTNATSFTCNCDAGFVEGGLNYCKDIDECTDGGHNCHSNASCTNVPGSFNCVCISGYFGNGIICTGTTPAPPASKGWTTVLKIAVAFGVGISVLIVLLLPFIVKYYRKKKTATNTRKEKVYTVDTVAFYGTASV